MMKKVIMMIFVLAFIFAMNVQAVQATPIIYIWDGSSNWIYIIDNSVNDSNTTAGVITYNGGVGSNWVVDINTGITMPFLGSATYPYMGLNSVDVSSIGSGNLTIWFSEFGFTYNGTLTSSIEGITDGTTNFVTRINGIPISSFGPFESGEFSGTTSTIASLTPTSTLGLFSYITHTGAGSTNFDYEVIDPPVSVPEPGTLLLLGTGLIGVGVYRWRRMKKQK